MANPLQPAPPTARTPGQPLFHYAWVIVALTALVILMSSGVRSASSLLIKPLEEDFGWTRTAISSAMGLNLLVLGLASPLSGRLIDRYGPRGVMGGSLLVLAAGAGGTLLMTNIWHLTLFWGILVGMGVGGVGSVMSATVANRWFASRRGLVTGLLSACNSTGQVIVLPILTLIIMAAGWRASSAVMAGTMLLLAPLALLLMRNDPEDVGLAPYGAADPVPPTARADRAATPATGSVAATGSAAGEKAGTMTVLAMVSQPVFWFLALSFSTCGATGAGIVGTHFMPHALEEGISPVVAATTLGTMGAVNFIGVIISGWLTDRIDPRKILGAVYALRGASLFVLPFVRETPGLMVFAIIYGLDWFATVPPTVTLVADLFGRRNVGTIYGWIFLAHQLGASVTAITAGALRVWFGDYQVAFIFGGTLGLLGGALSLIIPARRSPAAAAAA